MFARDDDERAARAAMECPGLVMTAREMEHLFCTSARNTVKICPILPQGWREERAETKTSETTSASRIRVSQVTARGAEAAKAEERAAGTTASVRDDEQGQLPGEEC
jgi:hypothetical protein